jgi:hypothetical protein
MNGKKVTLRKERFMKMDKLWLVFFYLLIISFMTFPSSGMAQIEPSNKYLAERNVALIMEGFAFTSGLQPDQQGKPNCIGTEIRRSGCNGSGFITKEDGTIVTNFHVIRRTTRGQAKFEDGGTYEIRNIKVYDPINDLAILKISGERRFSKVNLGDSNQVEPRDKVLAVGNPMGMGINVTEGRISQVVRDDNRVVAIIRHTAAIAPGNSGGALFKGENVIGVNVSTIINPQIGGSTGFHQAIPINKAKELLQNPEYDRLIPLQNVFPPDIDSITQKIKASGPDGVLHAVNGQVPAATPGSMGIWSLAFKVYEMEDILVFLESPGKDLRIIIADAGGNLIGCGDVKMPDYEMLFFSSEYRQDIGIGVINFDKQPANFGLKVFKIIW